MGRLDGKNILITEASQGLGRELDLKEYLWHEFGDLNLII